MEDYRVGIIGCGGIAREHVRAYGNISNVKIVSGAEVDTERREKFAGDFGLQNVYADYHDMLEKEALDIVSVCTWPKTHSDAVCEAAKSGCKGIMCEKPMATNLGEADLMLDASSQV